ncbi:MAG: Asp-tRNA(Asn)/Glu-tRNA(Gln) amidotransferase subunit GatC [Kiritimatiellae bacterium]|nr:Asp-tRNA(Asn)/Glu-tRNA(Gln) amidotransferase subunit GatC [Kiritimatiellia bacterium]
MNTASSQPDTIDIDHLCRLAHFDFTAEEKEKFRSNLSSIVGYVRKLADLDLDGIEPTQYGQPVVNAMRDDEVEASLPRDTVLANAPDASQTEFRMPRIVE